MDGFSVFIKVKIQDQFEGNILKKPPKKLWLSYPPSFLYDLFCFFLIIERVFAVKVVQEETG